MIQENKLIVADKGWAESLPEWILDHIKIDRLMIGISGDKTERVGDAETLAYLFTASLTKPISYEYTKIYRYLITKKMPNIAEEIKIIELTEYEQGLLNELKNDLWKKRGGKIRHPLFEILKEIKK